MAKQLEGKRVAFLFTEGAEQVEVIERFRRPTSAAIPHARRADRRTRPNTASRPRRAWASTSSAMD